MELDISNVEFYLKIYIELDFEDIEFYIELDFVNIEFQNMGILLNNFKSWAFCCIFFKLGVNIHFSHEIRTQMFGNNILYKCSSINQKKKKKIREDRVDSSRLPNP